MSEVKKRYMNTRVYYGEYTLRHWLNLMLTRNIDLPEYQRSFVWNEDDVKRMVDSLKTGQFIMPVTIANYQSGEPLTGAGTDSTNLILDGQQRLTSLLLAYVGRMPIKEKFKESEDDIAHGDDSNEESIGIPMEWTYKKLLEEDPLENTLDKIKERLRDDEKYSKLEVDFERNITT